MAGIEDLEKGIARLEVLKGPADASHEILKSAVESLSRHNTSDNELIETRGRLEDSAREKLHRDQQIQQMRSELERLRKVIADLLTFHHSFLDELEGEQEQ